MLKHGQVNPLTVFGLRQVERCPPHFTKVPFPLRTNEKDITDWVWENLSGRFWYGDFYSIDEQNRSASEKCIAFEIPGEATMFMLILDTINKYDSN